MTIDLSIFPFTPHGVQVAALEKVHPLMGGAYLMEQGLGKTLTALMDFLLLVNEGKATRMVVIAPNSFKKGWIDEAEKWGLEFDMFIYEPGNEYFLDKWMKKSFTKPPVLIINFDSTRAIKEKKGKRVFWHPNNGMKAVEKFITGRSCVLVVDESIQVSTFDTLQTVGVMMLAEQFDYQRILSGKWMKQGLHDTWSQLRIIGQMRHKDYYSFRGGFCRLGGFAGKQVIGSQNEDMLAMMIDHVLFRATKADWTDLPPKIPMPREYQLGPELKGHYKRMEDDFITWLENGDAVTIDVAITKYIKLAQIQAGFLFDENRKAHMLVEPSKNPRLNLLSDILDNQVPGKAIVVYNHKPVREMLLDRLEKRKPVFLHGGMTDDEISDSKDRFNNDRDCRTICITKSAKYGHTLLGDQTAVDHACADMVFYENTYSLDDRSQLEDRAHRHGQVQETMRYWDLIGTPLDKGAVKALQRKESVFQFFMSQLSSSGALSQTE